MSLAPLCLGESPPSSFSPPSTSPSASTAARVRARSVPAQQLKYWGLTRQQRPLLLRGAGFQSIALPARDINCRTPVGSPKPGSQVDGKEDEQTTPRGVGRTRRYTEGPTGNPLGILEEINNSAARSRKASWVDNEDRPSSHSSVADENTPPDPSDSSPRTAKMRSRGGSLTPQTPSPIAKNTKRRPKRSPTFRSSYLESAQYIEHLESQLVALQTQLQSLTSPTTTKAHSAKLRALTSESRLLRQELSEWETRFNERVREEVGGRVELEARIKTLERELDVKEGKVRELQWEMEVLEAKARAVGTVEAENISLGRRVDLLTELLAHSPTKLAHGPIVSLSTDGQQKRPRPRSMFPLIVPSASVCAPPLSIQAGADSKRDSVRSTSSTSTLSQSHWSDDYEDLLHHYPSKRNRVSTDLESIFSGVSAPSSLASTQPSVSRPMSVISDTLISPGTWGLPAPSPLSRDRQIRSNRRGRMRRFPSGSSAPKSLILPTTSNTLSLSTSALPGISPEYMHEVQTAKEFMSAGLPSLPFSTPRNTYRSASSWAEKETLSVLEANSTLNRPHPNVVQLNETPSPSSQLSRYQESEANLSQGTPAQGDSLYAEISRVEGGPLPLTETPQSSYRSIGTHISPNDQVCSTTSFHNQISVRRPAHPISTAGLGGFLWKLSTILSEAWQNPVKIARRVVAAGLSAREPKAAGEMDWWLLGILLRPIRREDGGENTSGPEKRALLDRKSVGGFGWSGCLAEASKAGRLGNDVEYESFSGESKMGYESREIGRKFSGLLTVRTESTTSSDTIRYTGGPVAAPSHQRLLLWIEFTVALIVAVGMAVKDGPAALLPRHATVDAGVMTDHEEIESQNSGGHKGSPSKAEEYESRF